MGVVVASGARGRPDSQKPLAPAITLLAGLGVAGDARARETVKHRSR